MIESNETMQIFPLRLHPHQDLKGSLQEFVEQQQIEAGFILTAVGSLQQANLRLAGRHEGSYFPGSWEIISLVGTLSQQGLHLHIGLADQEGETLGGHLLPGCLIRTTAEIVLGATRQFTFKRRLDSETGFRELHIEGP